MKAVEVAHQNLRLSRAYRPRNNNELRMRDQNIDQIRAWIADKEGD